jgi:hypothetical protein
MFICKSQFRHITELHNSIFVKLITKMYFLILARGQQAGRFPVIYSCLWEWISSQSQKCTEPF